MYYCITSSLDFDLAITSRGGWRLRGRAARKNIVPCSLHKCVQSLAEEGFRQAGMATHSYSRRFSHPVLIFYSNELNGDAVVTMPFVTVHGKRLHYADTKANAGADAHTIVFVHGLGSTQNYFFPMLPALARYRCLTLDTYGAGRSRFDGQEHSIESMGGDVLALLDGLKVGRAVVVGHPMGGMLPTHL